MKQLLPAMQVQTLNGNMEINSLSAKESIWQHSRKCEGNIAPSNLSVGKTFITCIVEK
jgi:hypothetical protein